jgi:hypothetical protein
MLPLREVDLKLWSAGSRYAVRPNSIVALAPPVELSRASATVKNICRFRLANLAVERFDVLICPNMHRFAPELHAIVDND